MRLLRSIPFVLASLAAVAACGAPGEDGAQRTSEGLSRAPHPLATPRPTSATDVFAGDFDGNGMFEAARWLTDGSNLWNVGLSCGAGFNPALWAGDWGSDGPIHVGDLNGDGKSDVFMFRSDNVWTVNLSNGGGWNAAMWSGAWGTDGPNFVGDLNGDGKSDVFMWRGWNNDWTVNLSRGSGFDMYAWTGAWGSDGPIHIGDLNGDGKTDVFMWRDVDKVWTVNLSTGSGWNAALWSGDWGSDGPINVGDLNGDGKTDVFMWRDADKVWTVNLSTGNGFAPAMWYGDWGSDGPINVGDLNGDGKDDVFMWRGDVWTVNISTGSGFAAAEWSGNPGSAGPIHVADINGDKMDDVFMYDAVRDVWSVNISTGSGFIPGTWAAEPNSTVAPSITSIVATPSVSPPGGQIELTGTASLPPGCVPWATSDAFSNGRSVGGGFLPIGIDANGNYNTAYANLQPRPVTISVVVGCKSNNACVSSGPSAQANVAVEAPPSPKIRSFTTSPIDGDDQHGRQCYGLQQTFKWSASFPSQCAKPSVTLSATDDDSGNKEFFVAKNLPASGTLSHKANTDAHYTLVARCLDTGTTSAPWVIPVSIAPAAQCQSGGTKGNQTFCFKAVGIESQICTVDEIVSDNKADAQAEFQYQFPPTEFNDSSISCANALSACPGL